MKYRRSRHTWPFFTTLAAVLFSGAVAAPAQMMFSVYSNTYPSPDYSLMYTSVTLTDNTTGCYHSGYTTQAGINSPDGRTATTSGSGLTGHTSIAVNNVLGKYTPRASVNYYCSCIRGNGGGGGGGVPFDIYSWINTFGLSGIVQSVIDNGNNTYGIQMSRYDYDTLNAATQRYLQNCGCQNPDASILLQALRTMVLVNQTQSVLMQVATVRTLQWLGIMQRDRTPIRSQTPNSTQTYPSPKGEAAGKTVRKFGPDGRAVKDIDYGDQAHSGNNPEVHDWDWSSGTGVRGPGRAPAPGEVP